MSVKANELHAMPQLASMKLPWVGAGAEVAEPLARVLSLACRGTLDALILQ